MSLAVNPLADPFTGELIATVLFTIAAIIGFIVAYQITKKKRKPKPEDTLPPAWRDHFFS